MNRAFGRCLLGLVIVATASVTASGTVIDFTGGTVTQYNPVPPPFPITNNAVNYNYVDYYTEGGFKLDFIGNTGGADAFAANVGNYYGVGNDVIHGHWATGNFGDLTRIEVTQIGGGTFDLNYFILTSNTDTGGGPASGNEKAYIHASLDGVTSSYSQLLPKEDWGFPATRFF